MGRKLSNVYDHFFRLEPNPGQKGLVRYQCKKCDKQYASNATRLADHLKMSCVPGFQTNQRARIKSSTLDDDNIKGKDIASEDTSDGVVTTVASINAQTSCPNVYATTSVETAQSLALKRVDQQLLSNILESEDRDPPDITEVLLRLAKLSTCVIGDAMAQMKIQGHLVGVDLIRGYDTPLAINICGPALTVQMMPIAGAQISSRSYDYIDTVEMGQVIVISAPTGITSAVFGGLLATASKARNVAGIVTDGRVQDVQDLCTMNFPAFATGTSVHGETGSTTIGEVNCPIVVSGCVVRHNDIIRGDINGVIVIPAECAQDIATRGEIIEDQDRKIVEALNEGEPLKRSFHQFRSRDI
ncbi:demethylmenaquinone methyltransferase [Plasmopara halstedii]|uniref:Demethylmenaquinone methyltransferase n=1 Tax=Plasmopara halstedii TaxID=4781 RepID=A0A0P1B882_PLAHL|nr:demethylmenaquinone methyltransferase [Plasmopara halstedii]CEG50201.1 demethylmenaquinone methyltransferase [Plasmopara halstedii]|eukprot:XP_024586570.1 demethylmenaquinone methyltransferase [Plasmopara halstedii]